MRRSIIFIFTLLTLANIGFAQRYGRSKKQKSNVEKFVLVPFAEAMDSDSIKIVTYMEIPFHALQFVKKGELFFASYQASIGIKDKHGQDLDHNVWTDSIKVSSYTDTKSAIKNRKHFTIFKMPVGKKYEVVGELQDSDTRKKGILKNKIDLRDYTKKPTLMKPNFLLDLAGDWGFKKGKIPTRGYRVREIGQGVDLNISGFVNHEAFEVDIFFTNGTAVDSLIQRFNGTGEKGYFNENIFIASNMINSLKNDFRIVLTQKKRTDEKNVSFITYKPGVSNFVHNIDLALKQMKYIMTNEERVSLKGQSKKNKEQIFYTLWKKRDPTPGTEYNEIMEEYYSRVWYANEHFDAWQPGWETDRGMIYILFGPPDEIQRTNPSTSNASLFQVWSYYKISKQFVFRDQNGFGDYRLDTPFLGAGL